MDLSHDGVRGKIIQHYTVFHTYLSGGKSDLKDNIGFVFAFLFCPSILFAIILTMKNTQCALMPVPELSSTTGDQHHLINHKREKNYSNMRLSIQLKEKIQQTVEI